MSVGYGAKPFRHYRKFISYLLSIAISVCYVFRQPQLDTPKRELISDSHPTDILSTDYKDEKHRLYCMVPFIWNPKNVPVYHAIKSTWGQRCDILKFFIDPIVVDNQQIGSNVYFNITSNNQVGIEHYEGDGIDQPNITLTLPDDIIVLHDMKRYWHTCDDGFYTSAKNKTDTQQQQQMSGNCRNIWEKIWRTIRWIDTNNNTDLAHWFVKVDSDTYLFPKNMKHYVSQKNWSYEDHHYFGHKLWHTDRPGQAPIVAGSAVFFSGATVKRLALIFRDFKSDISNKGMKSCSDSHLGNGEEVITAVCLKTFNVSATPVLDTNGNELVSIGPIEETLLWNRTYPKGFGWYWHQKPKTHPDTGAEEMHLCCGDLPLAFHGYKNPKWFYKLEDELYGDVANVMDTTSEEDDWRQYNWSNSDMTLRYFDRVKEAMKANKNR